ncbi:hypothetical protein ACPXCO_23380 [Streptomyces cyaneofuscatus]|uniref:hypothetical protein n=1 Tax=Streptomyces cyaneofuscatus TaxID=66883 RepID=UPI003CEAF09D
MTTKETEDQEAPGELEDLFDAPEGGADDPFSNWGDSSGPSVPAVPVRPLPRVPNAPVAPPQPPAAPIEGQGSDDPEARNGQSGFRLSQDVADRLKEYRQANDLTVTEVVIEALDYVAEDVPSIMARAKMPARVTPKRSRFAARGSKGPLKGTGPVQRWWQPTKGDKQILMEMAAEASVRDSPGVLIAVALNEFLPGGAMYIAGQLRPQIEGDSEFQVPSDLTLSRTFGVSREAARQGLLQLQIEGLIPVD